MSYREEWETAYTSPGFRNKNEYPYPEIISFVMRNFGRLEEHSHIRILEVGCGWGNNLRFLAEKSFDYHGIDFSLTAIEHCRHDLKLKNVLVADMLSLPYRPGTFHCVLDRMAVQHNPKESIDLIFLELRRVLKKSGLLLSVLAASGDFGYETSYLSEAEVEELGGQFEEGFALDYIESSVENRRKVYRAHILTARK